MTIYNIKAFADLLPLLESQFSLEGIKTRSTKFFPNDDIGTRTFRILAAFCNQNLTLDPQEMRSGMTTAQKYDQFNDKLSAILEKITNENDKKLFINIMLYAALAGNILDHSKFSAKFLEKFKTYIDFDGSYIGDEVFGSFNNNLLKCLIFNEKWHSADTLLSFLKQHNIKIQLDHEDTQGKSDISAFIINCAPSLIVRKYLNYANQHGHKIDWFKKDKNGYAPIQLAIAFGRNDILESSKKEIEERLKEHPDLYQIIQEAQKIDVDQVNKIMLNNGGSHSFETRTVTQLEGVTQPIDRPNTFDWSLRTMVQLSISQIQGAEDMQALKKVLEKGKEPDDVILKRLIGEDTSFMRPDIKKLLEEQGNNPEDFFAFGYDGDMLLFSPKTLTHTFPEKPASFFFDAQTKKETRKQTIERGKQKCSDLFKDEEKEYEKLVRQRELFEKARELVVKSKYQELKELLDGNDFLLNHQDVSKNTLLHYCTNLKATTLKKLTSDLKPEIDDILLRRAAIVELLITKGAGMDIRNQANNETFLEAVNRLKDSPKAEEVDKTMLQAFLRITNKEEIQPEIITTPEEAQLPEQLQIPNPSVQPQSVSWLAKAAVIGIALAGIGAFVMNLFNKNKDGDGREM